MDSYECREEGGSLNDFLVSKLIFLALTEYLNYVFVVFPPQLQFDLPAVRPGPCCLGAENVNILSSSFRTSGWLSNSLSLLSNLSLISSLSSLSLLSSLVPARRSPSSLDAPSPPTRSSLPRSCSPALWQPSSQWNRTPCTVSLL